MTKPTVYEANAYLYGFNHLIGKPAQLEFLPTEKSRKWRKGSLWVRSYSEASYDYAMGLIRQGEFYAFRFVAG